MPVTAQSEVGLGIDAAPLARQPDGRLPLEGTPWRLEAYQDGGRRVTPAPEIGAFITFGRASYAGSGGCSKVEGTYGVIGRSLSLDPKRLRGRDCAKDLATVQQAVESGLKRASAFAIEPGGTGLDDELVIYSVTGAEVLRYGLDDISPLDGGEWRLQSYTRDGQVIEASEELPGLLSFRPDSEAVYKRRQSGPLAGTSGCNGIVGEFGRRGSVLTVGRLELTDAPCTDELAAQEAAMTAVLDARSIRIDLPADRLTLTATDSGEHLEFVSQTPLEGTTWWLQRTAAEGSTRDARITLRLEEGIASGEGPCGPYTASYVTDGIFITFTDARTARDDSCSELRSEQALIAGLRRSATVDRGSGTLEFADASGSLQLTFGRPFAP